MTDKEMANLGAQCALRGFTLHLLAGDYGPLFVVTRDELTRQCNQPTEVWLWLLRIDAQRSPASAAAGLPTGTPLKTGAV